jgi:hypothetical protein
MSEFSRRNYTSIQLQDVGYQGTDERVHLLFIEVRVILCMNLSLERSENKNNASSTVVDRV